MLLLRNIFFNWCNSVYIRDTHRSAYVSSRYGGVIIKKVKLQVERERGQLEEKDDYSIESKSKITVIELFSELRYIIYMR